MPPPNVKIRSRMMSALNGVSNYAEQYSNPFELGRTDYSQQKQEAHIQDCQA